MRKYVQISIIKLRRKYQLSEMINLTDNPVNVMAAIVLLYHH